MYRTKEPQESDKINERRKSLCRKMGFSFEEKSMKLKSGRLRHLFATSSSQSVDTGGSESGAKEVSFKWSNVIFDVFWYKFYIFLIKLQIYYNIISRTKSTLNNNSSINTSSIFINKVGWYKKTLHEIISQPICATSIIMFQICSLCAWMCWKQRL